MIDVSIYKKFLTPNKYSRPTTKLYSKPKGIVVHWTASPQGSARGVWNYFERRKSGTGGYGSAHYIVDLDGDIWHIIPNDEIAYHVGSKTYTDNATRRLGSYPNGTTIGIEFCVIDNQGHYNEATYQNGAKLVAYLLAQFNLDVNDIWTHHGIVGWKDCPRLFVNNPNEYQKFKDTVSKYLNGDVEEIGITDPSNTNAINEQDDYYVVKSGDTLWGIAQAFKTTVADLMNLNPNINPKVIPVGTKVIVRKGTKTYIVQKGDTLWGIASKFNVSVSELERLNPNVNPRALQIGETIYISSLSTPKQSPTKPTNYEDILPNVVLRHGDTGENVRKLQMALNKLYFKVGTIDGVFGNATLDALKRYQSMYIALEVDGVFGSKTREHMLEKLIK